MEDKWRETCRYIAHNAHAIQNDTQNVDIFEGKQFLPTCKGANIRPWIVNTVALEITHYYPPPEISAHKKKKSEYILRMDGKNEN